MALIIANLKMHFTLLEAEHFCMQLLNSESDVSKLIICTSTPYLAYLAKNFPKLTFASQNISQFNDFGAYTGEYSAAMIKSCGVKYAIIGHSERRSIFAENDEVIKEKINNCIDAKIVPILCIGESQEARINNEHLNYLSRQLTNSLPNRAEEIVIAYEPIWSIGTGHVASVEQLTEVFTYLDKQIAQSLFAKKATLVYGGSVNLTNIDEILSVEKCSGTLIGGAALRYENLIKFLMK